MSKIPRKNTILTSIDDNFKTIDKLTIDTDGLHVYDADTKRDIVNETGLEVSYKRKNGKDKVITRVTGVDLNSEDMFSKYDVVCVSDTNTKVISNMKYSVSCFMIGQLARKYDDRLEYDFTTYLIGWESTDVQKPENYAWCVLMEKVNGIIGERISQTKVLILVDSDLGNHKAFNDRSLPILDGFYLPRNFKIAYASSDKNSGFSATDLMKKCDKEANDFFDEIRDSIV